MPRFRITVSYDGTDFVGWQRQAAGVSIQQLLEEALAEFEGGPVTVHGAGRTDAGVHALGQVAAFMLQRAVPPGVLVRGLNAKLPGSVRVLEAGESTAAFHPRFDARAKTYRYRIWNGEVVSPFERRYVLQIVDRLDVDAMNAAARMLEGAHDFAAFQTFGSDVSTTIRTITSSRVFTGSTTEDTDANGGHGSQMEIVSVPSVESRPFRDLRGGALITFEISGNGFLRHMVRAIVGTLIEVGRGRRAPESMRELLASRDRAAAGQTAPAAGLFLVRVEY